MTQDKFLWLEDIFAESSLKWVDEQNEATQKHVADEKALEEKTTQIEKVLNIKNPLLGIYIEGQFAYRLYKTPENQRGVFQRTPAEKLYAGNPTWEDLLDLKALSDQDGKEYVLQDEVFLDEEEGGDRCLLFLSDGGKDAREIKEFDLNKKEFIQDSPFYLAEGKHDIVWLDKDTCFVCWAGGKLSKSGYPLEVRKLKRGEDIAKVPVVFTGAEDKIGVWINSKKDNKDIYISESNFFSGNTYVLENGAQEFKKLDVTEKTKQFEVFHVKDGTVTTEINGDWDVGGKKLLAGSVIRYKKDNPKESVEVLFQPKENESIEQVKIIDEELFINLTRDAHSTLIKVDKQKQVHDIKLPHDFVTISNLISQKDNPNLIVVLHGFLQSTSYYQFNIKDETPQFKLLHKVESAFETQDLVVKQEWIKSLDGTKFPYFLIHKKDVTLDGNNPTLLYGYGGFNVSMTPRYNGINGMEFLDKGGVYVMANIRGGGEFGPKWHEAALREKRHKAYEDFIAAAEDLIQKGYTNKEKLAIKGGSNGGLLMGNMLTQRPDLFKVVLCGVPLLDMKRYHLLLAGESWTREYGNPDIPEEWEFLQKYSPYQNLKEGVEYPNCLFTTTTLDDRVHPGHARKMAAKMQEMGLNAWLHENKNGGHGVGATAKDQAHQLAVEFLFLQKYLF